MNTHADQLFALQVGLASQQLRGCRNAG
jgi:hypothetical protein